MDQVLSQVFSGGTGRLVLVVLAAGLLVRFSSVWRLVRLFWRRGPNG